MVWEGLFFFFCLFLCSLWKSQMDEKRQGEGQLILTEPAAKCVLPSPSSEGRTGNALRRAHLDTNTTSLAYLVGQSQIQPCPA